MAGTMNLAIIKLPNLLTLSRIVLTPVIVYAILREQAGMALILMIVAGFSDGLDGYLAKRFHQQTTLGAYLDPIADKLLLVSSIVALFLVDRTPLFLFLAVVFRDVIILIGALAYEMVTHQLQMQPTHLSKATTAVQIAYVAIVLLSMAYPLSPLWLSMMAWLTFAITCASGLHYMWLWTLKAVRAEGR